MRRMSGLGIGTASGSGWSMIASASSPVSTIAANASSCPHVRSSSPRRRASGRPVSASATATISSPAARRRAAAPRSRAARLARSRSAPERWTAAAAATAARTSSGVASLKLGPGSPVRGSTELKVAAMPCTLPLVRKPNQSCPPLRPISHRSRPASATRTSPTGSPPTSAPAALAPGERLPSERDLARRLEVGRASVREAIASLQVAGHDRDAPRRGLVRRRRAPPSAAASCTTPARPTCWRRARCSSRPSPASPRSAAAPDPEIEALLAAMEDASGDALERLRPPLPPADRRADRQPGPARPRRPHRRAHGRAAVAAAARRLDRRPRPYAPSTSPSTA